MVIIDRSIDNQCLQQHYVHGGWVKTPAP